MALFLTCGEMTSTTCTIGDYVIEWRSGDRITGTTAFVSASANPTDSDIQIRHPFSEEVIQSGTLYPIIRYCELDGQLYSADPMAGAIVSDDFKTCLPPITIEDINCSSEYNSTYNEGTVSGYRYNMIYSRTINGTNKSRSFRYYFGTTTKYISFLFDADMYADQLKIYYCTPTNPTGVLIENFIVGSLELLPTATNMNVDSITLIDDYTPNNYPITPKKVYKDHNLSITEIKNIIDLNWCATEYNFTRTNNDYLIIDILGAYNSIYFDNTAWNLGLQCHDEFGIIPNNLPGRQVNKLVEPTLVYNTGSCDYLFSYNIVGGFAPYPLQSYSEWGFSLVNIALTRTIKFALMTMYGNTQSPFYKYPNIASIPYMYIEKNVNSIKINFNNDSLNEYNTFISHLSGYTTSGSPTYWFSEYINNNTNVNYFTFLKLRFYNNTLSCADKGDIVEYFIHPSDFNNIDYDYTNATGKTIYIPLSSITNGVVNAECDGNKYEKIEEILGEYNTSKNTVINFQSNCMDGIDWRKKFLNTLPPTNESYGGLSNSIEKFFNTRIYNLVHNTNGINESSNNFSFRVVDAKIVITADLSNYDNTNPSHRNNVLNNWNFYVSKRIRTGINDDTTYELVFSVIGGVKSFHSPYI